MLTTTINPMEVAARCNPSALRDPCTKEGWYVSEDHAKRELRHIQQYRKGPASNHFPVRYYECPLHMGIWHLTSRPALEN